MVLKLEPFERVTVLAELISRLEGRADVLVVLEVIPPESLSTPCPRAAAVLPPSPLA